MSEEKPTWVKMKPAELEKIVLALHKEGKTPAQIGLILRDKHAVPKAKLIGKRISQILKEAEISLEIEKTRLKKKKENLENHIKANKHDYSATRSLQKHLWVISKLKN